MGMHLTAQEPFPVGEIWFIGLHSSSVSETAFRGAHGPFNSSSAARYSHTGLFASPGLSHRLFEPRHTTLPLRIDLADAGVRRKAFVAHQPFGHAAPKDALEQIAEGFAVAKPAMLILGERRVVHPAQVDRTSYSLNPQNAAAR